MVHHWYRRGVSLFFLFTLLFASGCVVDKNIFRWNGAYDITAVEMHDGYAYLPIQYIGDEGDFRHRIDEAVSCFQKEHPELEVTFFTVTTRQGTQTFPAQVTGIRIFFRHREN